MSWDVMPGELSIAAEEVWALENVSAFHARNHHRSPLGCQKVREILISTSKLSFGPWGASDMTGVW